MKYFLKLGGLICIKGAEKQSSESVGGVTDIKRVGWFGLENLEFLYNDCKINRLCSFLITDLMRSD